MIQLREARIDFNLLYVALMGRPFGRAAAAAPAEPGDKPAELVLKAVPISMELPAAIVRPDPPGDQIWQLSNSVVIEAYDDAE